MRVAEKVRIILIIIVFSKSFRSGSSVQTIFGYVIPSEIDEVNGLAADIYL